jgi:hypothetical protein
MVFRSFVAGPGELAMTRKRPRSTSGMRKRSLEQLMNARSPLLFSGMPRMLRGDGTMGGALHHEFRYFEDIQIHPAPVSADRWRAALQKSRILRVQRRTAGRAR